MGPRCGDGACNPALESCYVCPQDGMACAPVCGDVNESHATCPGGCP